MAPEMRTTATFALALSISVVSALACRPASPDPGPAPTRSDSAVIAEARAFMEEYARDLLAGDRPAIAARYDRTGAILVRNGEKSLVSYGDIVARYARAEWSPPAAFEWRDLSYEAAGPDAVVVVGRFLWTAAGGANPLLVAYTALLRRQDGELRIRVEDETQIRAQRPPATEVHSTRTSPEPSSYFRQWMKAPLGATH